MVDQRKRPTFLFFVTKVLYCDIVCSFFFNCFVIVEGEFSEEAAERDLTSLEKTVERSTPTRVRGQDSKNKLIRGFILPEVDILSFPCYIPACLQTEKYRFDP